MPDELCGTLDHHLLCIDMIGCVFLLCYYFFFWHLISFRLLTIDTLMFNELGIEKGLLLYYIAKQEGSELNMQRKKQKTKNN